MLPSCVHASWELALMAALHLVEDLNIVDVQTLVSPL